MTLKPAGCLTLAIFYFFLSALRCPAQDKAVRELGSVTAADFTLPANPIIDSNASAVILAATADIRFVGNAEGWFDYVLKVHKRIKILNKKAFDDLATVHVWQYRGENLEEKLDKVAASSYNLENGQVTEVKLDKKDIFQDRMNKEYVETKFTIPGIREGSIIDYTYTITSNYDFALPAWQFQYEQYPCLWSELLIAIPQTLWYVIVKQGIHPYAVDRGSEGAETYLLGGRNTQRLSVSANTTRHHWIMKDIPALHVENYLSCPQNYLDKIEFQLARTYNGEEWRDVYNTWGQATKQLLEQEDFGKSLEDDNSQVATAVSSAVSGADNPMARARAIYYYLCDHFSCTNYSDKYIQTSLSDVIKKHSGTVGDINLLLVAMLRKIGLTADPVVLSTREHGFNLASYPVLTRLNYVIARVVIYGNVIFLDAAHPKLGFGQLDGDCYNGHARIISLKDSGSVYFEADSLKEKKTTVVYISATDKGAEGTWQSTLGPQESYELREQVGEKGEKEYFKGIQTRYGDDVTISDEGIDSLEKPELPAKVHYSFRLREDEGVAKIYVNPFIGEGLRENPFRAAERKYPVEMPNVRDETYVFTMQIPDGYSVEEMPKSTRASLNGQDGSFEYLIGAESGMVQVRCRLKLNRANFAPEDYNSLRQFYGLVVAKEAEPIVLKKN